MAKPSPVQLPPRVAALSRSTHLFARSPGRPRLSVSAATGATRLELLDVIGEPGITARAFSDALRRAAGDVVVAINSPGGSVFEGLALFNMLAQHRGRVTAQILGVAASAASVVAMAADEIVVAPTAHLMIHRSWGLTVGNSEEHTKAADVLARIDGSLVQIYADRTGVDARAVEAMMSAETWFTAEEAIDQGFADAFLEEAPDVRASFDLSCYAAAPAHLSAPAPVHDITTRADLERALRGIGLSRTTASRVAAGGWPALSPRHEDEELARFLGKAAALAHELAEARKQNHQ